MKNARYDSEDSFRQMLSICDHGLEVIKLEFIFKIQNKA